MKIFILRSKKLVEINNRVYSNIVIILISHETDILTVSNY